MSIDISSVSMQMTNINETSQLIMSLVNKLKTSFEQYSLNENNMIDYVMRVMTLVEMNNKLSGFEKKAVVIEVINKLVDSSTSLSDESKISLKLIIKVVVPGVIEAVIASSKGLTNINKQQVETEIKKCCCFF